MLFCRSGNQKIFNMNEVLNALHRGGGTETKTTILQVLLVVGKKLPKTTEGPPLM